jgi:hypothetical protein
MCPSLWGDVEFPTVLPYYKSSVEPQQKCDILSKELSMELSRQELTFSIKIAAVITLGTFLLWRLVIAEGLFGTRLGLAIDL